MFLLNISPAAIQAMNRYLENPILRKAIQSTPNKQVVADTGVLVDGKPTNLRLTIAQLKGDKDSPDYFQLKSDLALGHALSVLTWSKEYNGQLYLVVASSSIAAPVYSSFDEAGAQVDSQGRIGQIGQTYPGGSWIEPREDWGGSNLFKVHAEAHSKALEEGLW